MATTTKMTEERYAMLEDLRHDVYNLIRGMKRDELVALQKANGWYAWIDDALSRIDIYDSRVALKGLADLVGNAKPGPTQYP